MGKSGNIGFSKAMKKKWITIVKDKTKKVTRGVSVSWVGLDWIGLGCFAQFAGRAGHTA